MLSQVAIELSVFKNIYLCCMFMFFILVMKSIPRLIKCFPCTQVYCTMHFYLIYVAIFKIIGAWHHNKVYVRNDPLYVASNV